MFEPDLRNYFFNVRRSTTLFERVFFGGSMFDIRLDIFDNLFSSSNLESNLWPAIFARGSVVVGSCGRRKNKKSQYFRFMANGFAYLHRFESGKHAGKNSFEKSDPTH